MPYQSTKQHILNDPKINTPEEFIDMEEEKMWSIEPHNALRYERIERRKLLNWVARFVLSLAILGTFIFLIWLLFFAEVAQDSRDLVNIMIGAFVAVVAKSTDYWFKDKDDAEVKELVDLHEKNKDNNKFKTE